MDLVAPSQAKLLGAHAVDGLDVALYLKIEIPEADWKDFLKQFSGTQFEPAVTRMANGNPQEWWKPASEKDGYYGQKFTKSERWLSMVWVEKGDVYLVYLMCI